MKAIRFSGPRTLEYMDLPEPQLKSPTDVKIKVAYVGVCVDEMPFFRRDRDMLAWGNVFDNNINGHEMSGIIVELGEEARQNGFAVGDRVSGYAWHPCGECYYCRTGRESHCLNLRTGQGTLAEYIIWHYKKLIKLPDNVSLEEGSLTDPIGYAIHGVDRADIRIADKVLIFGGTLDGQLLTQLSRMRGATQITMVDPDESIRSLALSLGAEYAIDPTTEHLGHRAMEITHGLGYDFVFETSGNLDMLALGAKLLARHGTLAYSGIYGLNCFPNINLSEFYVKEATLLPYYMAPYVLPRVSSIMQKLNLKPLITKVYGFENALSAYLDTETGLYPHILIKVGEV